MYGVDRGDKMETTTIRIDRLTKARLEKLSAGFPLARYLRNLSVDLLRKGGAPNIKKQMPDVEVLLSKGYIRSDDMELIANFLSVADKGKIDLVNNHLAIMAYEFQNWPGDMSDSLLESQRSHFLEMIKHPERSRDDEWGRTLFEIANMVGANLKEIEALQNKLAKLTPEQIKTLTEQLRGNPDIESMTFKVKEDED